MSSLVSVVALIGSVGAAGVAAIDAVSAISDAGQARVAAHIPIPDAALMGVLAQANGQPENSGTAFADVIASSVPAEIANAFIAAQLASLFTAVTLALLVAIAAIGTLSGRLRWGLLSWLTLAGGAVLAVGSVVSQALATTAAEDLAIWMLPGDTGWLEPGFLAGIDFTGAVAGVVIMILGWAFRGSARYARDAEGVV
ncbi:MAG: hypothetical protein ACOH19_05520 [Rhodoglobus sp.]